MKKLSNVGIGTIFSIVSYLAILNNPVDARLSHRGSSSNLMEREPSTQIERTNSKNLIAQTCKNQEIRGPEIETGRAWYTCNYILEFRLDGNLVLSRRGPKRELIWASGTSGRGSKLVVQANGNVAIYNQSNQTIWASNTGRNPGAYLTMQDDGNLVVYNSNRQPIFATNTSQPSTAQAPGIFNPPQNNRNPATKPPTRDSIFMSDIQRAIAGRKRGNSTSTSNSCGVGLKVFTQSGGDENFSRAKQWTTCNKHKLAFQNDGNLVLYSPNGNTLWATGTFGNGARMSFQADGNIVLYNFSNQPLWATNTNGNPGAFLAIQNDGNLVVYTQDNRAIFSTGTDGGKSATTKAAREWQSRNF